MQNFCRKFILKYLLRAYLLITFAQRVNCGSFGHWLFILPVGKNAVKCQSADTWFAENNFDGSSDRWSVVRKANYVFLKERP